MTYATAELTESARAEVMRAQHTKVSEWEVGRLQALLTSTASSEDRQAIERALRFQTEGKS